MPYEIYTVKLCVRKLYNAYLTLSTFIPDVWNSFVKDVAWLLDTTVGQTYCLKNRKFFNERHTISYSVKIMYLLMEMNQFVSLF